MAPRIVSTKAEPFTSAPTPDVLTASIGELAVLLRRVVTVLHRIHPSPDCGVPLVSVQVKPLIAPGTRSA
jgi:hypothetical protein